MRADPHAALARLRAEIDEIDEQVAVLLARRFDKTDEVGRWKARIGEDALNPERQRQRSTLFVTLARRHGLAEPLVLDLFGRLRDEVVARHELAAERSTQG